MNLRRKFPYLTQDSFDGGRCECGSDFHVATLVRSSGLPAVATWKSLPHSVLPQEEVLVRNECAGHYSISDRRLLLCKLHGLLFCALAAILLAAPLHAADREEAVAKVRNSLRQEDYPWYDKSRDAAERFSPEEEQQESDRKKRWRELLSLAINIIGLSLIAAGLGGLIYWLRKFTAKSKEVVQPTKPTQASPLNTAPVPGFDPSLDFLQASRDAAGAGDFKKAIVFLFNHKLVVLDQNHCIRLRMGGTNGQYLRQVGSEPVRSVFRRSVSVFEAVYFGGRPVDAAAYDGFNALYDQLKLNLVKETVSDADKL